MSVVRFIANENRLGKAMAGVGGKKAAAAIADANEALKGVASPCAVAVDGALLGIRAELGRAPGPLSAESRSAIYRHANEINAFAAFLDLEDMGKAAWSLCELIDVADANPPATRPAVEAHLKSLQLLRTGEALPQPERKALVEGLDRVLAHMRAIA